MFPLKANHLKLIHKVSDHKRRARFDLRFYTHSEVMFTLAGSGTSMSYGHILSFFARMFCRQENTDHFLGAFFDVLIYTFDVIIGPA